jgi:gamma-butyrobetaine dioxygenase
VSENSNTATENTSTLDRYKILQATMNNKSIEIEWGDGHQSAYHHVWLRHNCGCASCRHSGTDQNMNLIENIPLDIQPSELNVTGDWIELIWAGEEHKTSYQVEWLRSHCYSDEERNKRDIGPTLIGADFVQSMSKTDYQRYLGTDAGLLETMQALNKFGIAMVTAAVPEDQTIVNLAQRFGPIRETNYGAINDMKVHNDQIVISYTDAALTAHCDEPYCYEPLGIGFFHCMNSAIGQGGTSIFVDCFKIAEDLRTEDPEAFEILSTVPVQFMRDHPDEQEYRAEGALIALDYFGHLNGVRYAERPLAPLDIPGNLVYPYYRAFGEFTRRVRDPKNEIRFKMNTGDVVIFDNQRMTHGRTAFTGDRHLRTAYVERDFFHSKLRVLSRRAGNPIVGRLPGGARS